MRIDSRPISLFLLTAALVGQNDYNLDKVTSGALGQTAIFRVQGAPPNQLHVTMLSLSGGPTPIAVVDPIDPRSVEVGLDMTGDWIFGTTDGAGNATVAVVVPNNPILQGVLGHVQTLTAPGSPTIVNQISNDVRVKLGAIDVGMIGPATLATSRAFAVSYLNTVANAGGGDVLISGGGSGTLTNATGLDSTEILDFRELSVRAGPLMSNARALHTGTRLLDGRLLVCGGSDALGNVLNTCEIYDPLTNSWTPTGSMAQPRVLHAAVRLNDGRVLVAGGTNSFADPISALVGTLNSTEIWNPTTGTWATGPVMGGNRMSPALSRLPDGRIMLSGGLQVTFFLGIPSAAGTTNAVQISTTAAATAWAAGPSLPVARTGHHYSQVTLPNGRILMSGGVSVSVNLLTQTLTTTPLNNACVYDQPTNTWTSSTMNVARTLHSANLLPDGRVAVCGGAQGTLDVPIPLADVEVFTPSTSTWTVLPPLTGPRSAHASAVLPDGMLVLIGGQDAVSSTNTVEVLHF